MSKKRKGVELSLKARRGALLVEVDGKLHQAVLTPEQLTLVLYYAANLAGGTLPCMEEPLVGVSLGGG